MIKLISRVKGERSIFFLVLLIVTVKMASNSRFLASFQQNYYLPKMYFVLLGIYKIKYKYTLEKCCLIYLYEI